MSEKKKDHPTPKPGEKPKEEHHVEIQLEEAGPEKSSLANRRGQEPAGEKPEKKEPSPLENLQEQLAEKTREASENFDKWLRLKAELENFKKRMQKEKAELMKFGNESLLKGLLPILDNLERALNHGKEFKETSSLLEGVELTLKQFLNTLERFGVRPVPALGEIFDPEKHEAVSQVESDQEPNRVISEVQKGYFLQGRVLRPAKVIVSKEKAAATEGN